MKNLIKNSEWVASSGGGPMYFAGQGPVTYDEVNIDGCRSCSVTMIPGSTSPMFAEDEYTLTIPVKNQKAISWGYMMRVIDAKDIRLVADFYNKESQLITSAKYPVQNSVGLNFRMVMSKFMIPEDADTVKLSMQVNGMITAFTFYAPTAYFVY